MAREEACDAVRERALAAEALGAVRGLGGDALRGVGLGAAHGVAKPRGLGGTAKMRSPGLKIR